MSNKDRPLVDRTVFALAEHWMQDYETIADREDLTADREDLTWELADEIQGHIEGFFDEAERNGRVRFK